MKLKKGEKGGGNLLRNSSHVFTLLMLIHLFGGFYVLGFLLVVMGFYGGNFFDYGLILLLIGCLLYPAIKVLEMTEISFPGLEQLDKTESFSDIS